MNASVRVVEVAPGALDAKSGRALMKSVEGALQTGATSIVLDLSKVTFVDSMGIAVLVGLGRKTSAKIVLSSLSPYVATLAKLTHLHDVFDLYASSDAARFALAS